MAKLMTRKEFVKRTRKKGAVGLKLKTIGKIFKRSIEADEEERKK